MKTLLTLLLGLGLTFQVFGQDKVIQKASQAQVNAGTDDSRYVTAKTLAGRLNGSTITSNGIVQMSPIGGQNVFNDMFTATSSIPGQIGMTYGGAGDNEAALWFAQFPGLGSNAWGAPISFPGGVIYFGNPIATWLNLPKSSYSSIHFSLGAGPNASSVKNSWPSGTNGIGSSYQPGFLFDNGNPWAGGAWLGIRSAFTNSIHGTFVGTDTNGHNIYVPQFGFQFFQISDAYMPNATPLGAESQQAPSDNILQNDPAIDFYISKNGQRAGDIYNGQIPMGVLDTSTYGLNAPVFRIPLQTANAWMPRNPFWRDALMINESNGVASFNGNAAASVTFQTSTVTTNFWVSNSIAPASAPRTDSYTAGVEFQPTKTFAITALGRFVTNGVTGAGHKLILWDAGRGLNIAQVQVAATNLAIGWVYVYLDPPVWVTNGLQYYVTTLETNGDKWMGSDTVQTWNPIATLENGVFNTTPGADGQPNSVSGTYGFGPVSFLYASVNNVVYGSINPANGFSGIGYASSATNSLATFNSGGITNTTPVQIRVLGFTGTSVMFTNLVTHFNVSLGNISTPSQFILQPNDALIGSSCGSITNIAF